MAGNTHAERIVELLEKSPQLDDDEIAKTLLIEPRQTVNQICNRLAKNGVLRREIGPRGKIVNGLVGGCHSRTPRAPKKPGGSSQQKQTTRRSVGRTLNPPALDKTLVIIPCCKAKQDRFGYCDGGPSITDSLPIDLVQELQGARRAAAPKAQVDEKTLVPAYQRYDGALYQYSGREAIGKLLQAGARVVVLSGGYGLILAAEPIGMYEGALKPAWWPQKILQRCLVAYAKRHKIEFVRAFASATSPYRTVLDRVDWQSADIGDAMLLTPQVVLGGVLKSPATIGETLLALGNGMLTTDWQSSFGLRLDVFE